MAWDENIKGQVLEIAASDERTIRVLAGPGTGKTTSLMRKIARLLEIGVSPQKILLVTFTRTAAHDLKQELANLKIAGIDSIDAGTLHSFCFRMLQKNAVFKITGREPRPLFNFQKTILLKDLQKRIGVGARIVDKKLRAFESAWASRLSESPGWPSETSDKRFQTELLQILRFHKAILIGEVIPESLSYLKHNPMADEIRKYDFVFVDEYQDLNKAEQELINILATDSNLMIIGDEDQSIFEIFRYAFPEGIRTFKERHPETVDYKLDVCKRCPSLVVEASNALIFNNQNREKRELKPEQGREDGIIHNVQWQTFDNEIDGIARYIKQKIDHKINPGKILVMFPRRDMGYKMRDCLIENGIEAHSFFNEEIFEDPTAQEAFTLLNLIVNKQDRVALRCWLGYGSNNYDTTGYYYLLNHCLANNLEPFNAITQLHEKSKSIKYSSHILNRYEKLLGEFKKYEKSSTAEIINKLFPREEPWAFPIHNIIAEMDLEQKTLEEVVSAITTSAINPEMPIDVDFVRIMSIHKSKGLTADITIICGVNEGLIPRHEPDLWGREAERYMEEQRRLFYVGITRPRRELVISCVSEIPKTLGHGINLKVPYSLSRNMKAFSSTFLRQMGGRFPHPIRGEDWAF